MKTILPITAIFCLSAIPSQANAVGVWAVENVPNSPYEVRGVYGGQGYPSHSVTTFYNNGLAFDMRVSTWYATGCTKKVALLDTHVPPNSSWTQYATDPTDMGEAFYTWCASDARPSTRCDNGKLQPICLGGQ